jgi:hypothetical protein
LQGINYFLYCAAKRYNNVLSPIPLPTNSIRTYIILRFGNLVYSIICILSYTNVICTVLRGPFALTTFYCILSLPVLSIPSNTILMCKTCHLLHSLIVYCIFLYRFQPCTSCTLSYHNQPTVTYTHTILYSELFYLSSSTILPHKYRNILFERHIVCEQFILIMSPQLYIHLIQSFTICFGSLWPSSDKIFTLLLFSSTLINVCNWRRPFIIFVNVNANLQNHM